MVFLFLAMTVQQTAKWSFVCVQQIVHELVIGATNMTLQYPFHSSTHIERWCRLWICTLHHCNKTACHTRDSDGQHVYVHNGICLTGWQAVHRLWTFIKHCQTINIKTVFQHRVYRLYEKQKKGGRSKITRLNNISNWTEITLEKLMWATENRTVHSAATADGKLRRF